jgi:hypothetical protein
MGGVCRIIGMLPLRLPDIYKMFEAFKIPPIGGTLIVFLWT